MTVKELMQELNKLSDADKKKEIRILTYSWVSGIYDITVSDEYVYVSVDD